MGDGCRVQALMPADDLLARLSCCRFRWEGALGLGRVASC
jgi:hypothetical protein